MRSSSPRATVLTKSAHDRIFGSGFVFPGGMIVGKYYRAKFVERGLRTWRHPFFMRVAASIGRASKGKNAYGARQGQVRCALQQTQWP